MPYRTVSLALESEKLTDSLNLLRKSDYFDKLGYRKEIEFLNRLESEGWLLVSVSAILSSTNTHKTYYFRSV